MTEAEWLTATDPAPLLKWLDGPRKWSERKEVLYAASCVRRCWNLLHERSRQAVTVAEQYADGLAKREDLREAWLAAIERARWPGDAHSTFVGRAAARAASWVASVNAVNAVVNAALVAGGENESNVPGKAKEKELQAAFLRHIAGNPFRPLLVPAHLPRAVCDLAEALYSGTDCAAALHDALLEAGHTELAKHFRDPDESHPKGCFALDALLNKK